MKEADFQTLFGRWVKSGGYFRCQNGLSAGFELKWVRKGRSLAFSKVEKHQEVALMSCGGSQKERGGAGVFYKLSDLVPGYKPFDCFLLNGCAGWLVVGFEELGRWVAVRVEQWIVWRYGSEAQWRGGYGASRRGGVRIEEMEGAAGFGGEVNRARVV